MFWEIAEQITGTIQNAIAAISLVTGGLWGYYRFARFRTLKPRLEFSFDWNHETWNL